MLVHFLIQLVFLCASSARPHAQRPQRPPEWARRRRRVHCRCTHARGSSACKKFRTVGGAPLRGSAARTAQKQRPQWPQQTADRVEPRPLAPCYTRARAWPQIAGRAQLLSRASTLRRSASQPAGQQGIRGGSGRCGLRGWLCRSCRWRGGRCLLDPASLRGPLLDALGVERTLLCLEDDSRCLVERSLQTGAGSKGLNSPRGAAGKEG